MLSHWWRRSLTLRQALTALRAGKARPGPAPPRVEELEPRRLLSVTIAPSNNNGQGYAGLDFNHSGGYVPPDSQGAAGPSSYVETVNQTVAIYAPKATGTTATLSSLSTFWTTQGGLPRADSGASFSDPVVAYDDNLPGLTPTTGRFIVGDQNVDFNTGVSVFDFAVSKTSNPVTLTASDWNFYQINTTESGYSADYPGNLGYNKDAFVFVLNQFGAFDHAQVTSVSATDLVNGVARGSLHFFQSDINGDFSVRPATMHDAAAGAPMWLVSETGDGLHINVYKITNILSHFSAPPPTQLAVNSYADVSSVPPRQPNNTIITTNIDSRIQKVAGANNTLVAVHAVALSETQDAAQWYVIDVSGSTPVLKQQGDVSLGNGTYASYPAIDINPAGQIGMTFMDSGTGAGQFLSMYVTGRLPSDAGGTMATPVLVPAGAGQTNYHDFTSTGRAGDLGGINVDPSDGSFWSVNEFANTEATANWGTAIANFSAGTPLGNADVAVINSGPATVNVPTNATYTITVSNAGPNDAQNFVLTDTLPAGSSLVSMTQTGGTDSFSFSQSGGTVTETAGTVPAGNSDTFSLVVSAPASLANGANFSDTASVSSNNPDPNTANNTATVTGTVINSNPAAADLSVGLSGPATSTEGDTVTYTLTVANAGPNDAQSAVLIDTLPSLMNFVSATTSQGTYSQLGGVVTFSLGTVPSGQSVTATITAQSTEDGSVTDTASVSSSTPDPNTGNNSAGLTTAVAEPSINVSGPIRTSSRSLTNFATATFTHANGVEAPGAFIATINWGDGASTTGTVSQSGSTYTVTGSHSYKKGGGHTITTTVVEAGDGPSPSPPPFGQGGQGGGDSGDGDGGGGKLASGGNSPSIFPALKNGGKGAHVGASGAAPGVAGNAAGLVATLTSGHGSAPALLGAGPAGDGGREGPHQNGTAPVSGSHTGAAATGMPGSGALIDLFFLLSGRGGRMAHTAGSWEFDITLDGSEGR